MEKGTFLWNSGIFCFKTSTFLDELERHLPGFLSLCKDVLEKSVNNELDEELSLLIPSISVDYAIMEKSDNIKIVNADFVWSDMGSFEALYDYYKTKGHPMDNNGNMLIGSNKFTKFVGLKNTLVVDTEDVLLILDISEAQSVKHVFEDLERQDSHYIN
jgi:mannose-1-phosphate guanylyltransferase